MLYKILSACEESHIFGQQESTLWLSCVEWLDQLSSNQTSISGVYQHEFSGRRDDVHRVVPAPEKPWVLSLPHLYRNL